LPLTDKSETFFIPENPKLDFGFSGIKNPGRLAKLQVSKRYLIPVGKTDKVVSPTNSCFTHNYE
jgi:hypothetical protein